MVPYYDPKEYSQESLKTWWYTIPKWFIYNPDTIKKSNEDAKKIYESLWFKVRQIYISSKIVFLNGSLNCITNDFRN